MANNSTIDVNSFDIFLNWEKSILALILAITILLAIYGNCGLLYALYENDKMWTSTYMLIGNLATSGVLISLLSMPFSLAAVLVGRWPFHGEVGDAVCTTVGFVNSLLLNATIFTHTTISIGKYFAVVKPFSRAMTVKRTRIIIGITWLLAGIISSGPLFGFGHYSFGPTTLACGIAFPYHKASVVYLLILALIAFVTPILVMGFVYLNVYRSVRQHSQRLAKACSSGSVLSLEKKLVLTALSSLACFLLCWSPFCVFVLMSLRVRSNKQLPHALGISAYWCGFSYNAINPLIIGAMNSRFREGLRDVTLTLVYPFVLCWRAMKRCSSRKYACNESVEMQNVVTSPAPPVYCTYAQKEIPQGIPVIERNGSLLTLPSESPQQSRMTLSSSVSSRLNLLR